MLKYFNQLTSEECELRERHGYRWDVHRRMRRCSYGLSGREGQEEIRFTFVFIFEYFQLASELLLLPERIQGRPQ